MPELPSFVKRSSWRMRCITMNRPPWMIPVRHSLGATLMQNGRYAEAEQVYREDLKHLPGNGWSLFGLTSSLRAQKKNADEAAANQAKFKKLWAKADTKITSSCLCQPVKDVEAQSRPLVTPSARACVARRDRSIVSSSVQYYPRQSCDHRSE